MKFIFIAIYFLNFITWANLFITAVVSIYSYYTGTNYEFINYALYALLLALASFSLAKILEQTVGVFFNCCSVENNNGK